MATLENVKKGLGITGTALDDTITPYYNEVIDYLTGAGIPADKITDGLVIRGVADLWNYGGNEGTLSKYFYERASQLALKY